MCRLRGTRSTLSTSNSRFRSRSSILRTENADFVANTALGAPPVVSWQGRHFEHLQLQGCGSMWQAQHFVNLEVQIAWLARRWVNLDVQIAWQARRWVNLDVQIAWQAQRWALSMSADFVAGAAIAKYCETRSANCVACANFANFLWIAEPVRRTPDISGSEHLSTPSASLVPWNLVFKTCLDLKTQDL